MTAEWVSVILAGLSMLASLVATVVVLGMRLEVANLKVAITERAAGDKAELLESINGSVLRASVIEAEIRAIAGRLAQVEQRMEGMR